MDLKQMYDTLMQIGYDKPRVLNIIKQGMNPNVGYLISQYGESTPEVALANAYPEVFGYQEDHSVFPSDSPSLSGWNQDAYNSAGAFGNVPAEYFESPENYLSIANSRDFLAGLPNSVPASYRDAIMNSYRQDPNWLELINYLANKPKR